MTPHHRPVTELYTKDEVIGWGTFGVVYKGYAEFLYSVQFNIER